MNHRSRTFSPFQAGLLPPTQYGVPSPALGAWAANLQPASWRGVPFAVEVDTYRGGRRIALHEYPYRDDPWPEDTGRATRRITITGFLRGDDVFDQRAALIAALEQQGPGTLIHPSFGSITATLDGDFTIGQRKELGRVLQVEFGVIQTGATKPLYPVADASTQDNAEAAADTCDASCGSDFISDVTDALASGEAVVAGTVGTVAGFVATVVGSAATVTLEVEQAGSSECLLQNCLH